MSVHIIVALDRNNAIGRRGDLLFRIREDLRRFKALTMGGTLIMGRKTWESLPGALPGRRNIVVTRQKDFVAQGARTASSFEQALEMAKADGNEIFVIGGAQIYGLALPYADVLDLTLIDAAAPDADTFFPHYDADEFTVTQTESLPTEPPVSFVTLSRIKKS